MRFYYQAVNGFTELKYHGQASRLPYYNDGTVYGEYSTPGGEAITQTTGDDYAFGEYVYTAPADILVPFDTNYTIMDEQSSTKITLLCSDAEVIAPGTLVQLVYFKNDDDEWTPTDKDGKPWNYSNWVILQSNAQYFDHLDVYGKRYKHTYDMEEALTCFKDYPVRSSKTFAGGRYTYREVLDITLRLFLKPRVHDSTFVIKDNTLLDEPNSKLSYTNATVFDVVADIGRILDVTPNVEVKYEKVMPNSDDCKYVYYLEYLPNYGTIGEEVDISYFNLSNADTETSTRDTHAGAVISNVQNLVTDEGASYPAPGVGLHPNATNYEGDEKKFVLPLPIKDIVAIKIYYRIKYSITSKPAQANSSTTTMGYWGGNITYRSTDDVTIDSPDLSKPIIITKTGSTTDPYFPTTLPSNRPITQQSNAYGFYKGVFGSGVSTPQDFDKQIFIANSDDAKFLYAELTDKTLQAKDNAIVFSVGSSEIDLSPLFNSTYMWFGRRNTSVPYAGDYLQNMFAVFANETGFTGNTTMSEGVVIEINPLIEIVYVPFLSGAIKGENDTESETTVFFNQYGQVVSAEAFGNALNNYSDEMSSSSRIVGKIAEPIGGKSFYDLYKELPQVGCTVVDHERNKRYVVSQLSVTRQPQSLDLLAQLNERKKGRSQVVQADSSQYIAKIPDSEIQPSYTSASFVVALGLEPVAPRKGDEYDYMSEQLAEMLLNPITAAKRYDDAFLTRFTPDDSANSYLIVPALATTSNSVLFVHSFPSNRVVGSQGDNVVFYTDNEGFIKRAWVAMFLSNNPSQIVQNYPFFTNPSNIAKMFIDFPIELEKDQYEMTNITVQATVKPFNNLLLGRAYINRSPFGKRKDQYNEPLTICFYDTLIADEKESCVALPAIAQQETGSPKINISWDTTTPTHKAWALKRGNDVVLYRNEAILGQSFSLYWDLSLRIV